MALALAEQAAALRNPPQTVHQVVETLRRTVPRFAQLVWESGVLDKL
jgi:hypothetical protein